MRPSGAVAAALRSLPVLLGLLAVPNLGAALEDDPKEEEKRFQGTWVEYAVVIGKERFLQEAEGGDITTEFKSGRFVEVSGTKEAGRGKFILNPSKQPKEIDLIYDPNPRLPPNPPGMEDRRTVFKGIYEWNGDELRVCLSLHERPKRFAAEGEDFIIELRRKRK